MTLLNIIKKAVTFASVGDDEALDNLIETSSDILLQPEEKEQLMCILNHLQDMRATILDLESEMDDMSFN